jgi:hypothetical protein
MMTVRYRSKMVMALIAVVALWMLAACGVAATGGAPSVTPAQPTLGSAPTPQPTQASIGETAEPTSAGTGVASHGGPVQDQVSLIDALRTAGATVNVGDQIEQPFMNVPGTQLTVNGADVQVFEFADETAAQTDAAKLADVLAGRGTTMMSWVASPHAYRAGRVIALYVGNDVDTLKLLQGTLGAPFAEQRLPSSQQPTAGSAGPATAVSHGAGQVSDLVSLVDHLRATGFDVKPAGEVEQPFFDIKGTVLKVNGADVQVFEFTDAAAAKAAVATIGADGNPQGAIVEWVAPPHFYQTGRIVVLYVGADKAIIEALTKTLGPQVAGR